MIRFKKFLMERNEVVEPVEVPIDPDNPIPADASPEEFFKPISHRPYLRNPMDPTRNWDTWDGTGKAPPFWPRYPQGWPYFGRPITPTPPPGWDPSVHGAWPPPPGHIIWHLLNEFWQYHRDNFSPPSGGNRPYNYNDGPLPPDHIWRSLVKALEKYGGIKLYDLQNPAYQQQMRMSLELLQVMLGMGIPGLIKGLAVDAGIEMIKPEEAQPQIPQLYPWGDTPYPPPGWWWDGEEWLYMPPPGDDYWWDGNPENPGWYRN